MAASQLDPQGFDRFFAVFIPFTKNLANPGKKVDFRDEVYELNYPFKI